MSCSSCNSSPCSCLSPVQQPYYACAPVCAEDHTKNVYINQMSLGVTIQSAWNIPLCGASAVLSVPGLSAVSVGSFIWHDSYGYYEIVAGDTVNQTITVQNNCDASNASPGTQVPACTTFVVTPPSCCEDTGQDGVFVAIDFTAPANSTCLDITLTAVTGLIAGNNVQIGSGVYRLSEVKANNVVNICNDGEGILPGTSVIAQDFAGRYQYPVIQLSVNACVSTPATPGSVIACVSGSQKILDGATAGHVITLVDPATNTASYQSINANICLEALGAIGKAPGTNCLYVLTGGVWGGGVLNFPCADTSGFPVYISSDNVLRGAPDRFTVFGSGSSDCSPATGTLTTVVSSVTTAGASFDIVNPSSCRPLKAIIYLQTRFFGTMDGGATDGWVNYYLSAAWNSPILGSSGTLEQYTDYRPGVGSANIGRTADFMLKLTIPPGVTETVFYSGTLTFQRRSSSAGTVDLGYAGSGGTAGLTAFYTFFGTNDL